LTIGASSLRQWQAGGPILLSQRRHRAKYCDVPDGDFPLFSVVDRFGAGLPH
jgi:hypothetical protein